MGGKLADTWLQPMRRGFAELCVLVVLSRGESYGYELLGKLREIEALSFSESTLYPVLARMTEAGLLKVREGPSERGKNRRYYTVTRQGQGRLADLLEQWALLRTAIDELIENKEDGRDG